jgi:hypothetical protein
LEQECEQGMALPQGWPQRSGWAPQGSGGFWKVLPQKQYSLWMLMFGHCPQGLAWQGSSHSWRLQGSIFLQTLSQRWAIPVQHLSWHQWRLQSFLDLQTLSHKKYASAWTTKHSASRVLAPQRQIWPTTYWQGGQSPTWQFLRQWCPQSSFFRQGISQVGIASVQRLRGYDSSTVSR